MGLSACLAVGSSCRSFVVFLVSFNCLCACSSISLSVWWIQFKMNVMCCFICLSVLSVSLLNKWIRFCSAPTMDSKMLHCEILGVGREDNLLKERTRDATSHCERFWETLQGRNVSLPRWAKHLRFWGGGRSNKNMYLLKERTRDATSHCERFWETQQGRNVSLPRWAKHLRLLGGDGGKSNKNISVCWCWAV